jgi:hypothetical protein
VVTARNSGTPLSTGTTAQSQFGHPAAQNSANAATFAAGAGLEKIMRKQQQIIFHVPDYL